METCNIIHNINRNIVHILMESMQTVHCAVSTVIVNVLKNIFQHIELYMAKQWTLYGFNWISDSSHSELFDSNHFIYLFNFPMSNATMERTLSALQINFYFISSVCLQYVKKMPFVISHPSQWSNFRRKKIFYWHTVWQNLWKYLYSKWMNTRLSNTWNCLNA